MFAGVACVSIARAYVYVRVITALVRERESVCVGLFIRAARLHARKTGTCRVRDGSFIQ